jgi:putative acetyltransferase
MIFFMNCPFVCIIKFTILSFSQKEIISKRNTMLIRPFREPDLSALVDLFTQAVHAINSRDYAPEQLAVWAPASPDLAKWCMRLAALMVYVAEQNGEILGFMSMTSDGCLDHLYVSKDHRGGHVSRALFKQCLALAKEHGWRTITTHCSITARKPAERMGFKVIKEQTVVRDGVALTNYVMEKKVS